MSAEQSLIAYIAESWMGGNAEGLDRDLPIIELNIIDSAAIFDIVLFLQREFGVDVPLHEVSPDNFRTIKSIASLVGRLQQTGVVG
jgi:peptidyl carrier protein